VPRPDAETGFTLLEIIIAMLILAIIMVAALPAFYGLLRATGNSDQRSVADGLAVKATEQVRSFPYYDVGYSTTAGTPSYCTGTNPVQLSYSSPMDAQAAANTTTVAGTTYTVQSCVYWEQASDGSTAAYKQFQVEVFWGPSTNLYQFHYSQSSAVYPGGEGQYNSPGGQNFAPGTVTATTVPGAPAAPVANSAVAISTTIIQVDWDNVTFSPTPQYTIEYWNASNPRPSNPAQVPVGFGTTDGGTGLIGQVTGLSPGTTYAFDVLAVAGGSNYSVPSNVETATTSGTAPPTCTLIGINVSPNSPMVDKNGVPVGWSSLAVTVNASSVCTNLSVEYGINSASGDPQPPLTTVTLVGSGSTWTGTASQATWSATTYGFVVYNNGTASTLQANVTPCQEKGNSGHC
jgi:prepilin-type N-terminal cleavage/methylation domain-containing protein